MRWYPRQYLVYDVVVYDRIRQAENQPEWRQSQQGEGQTTLAVVASTPTPLLSDTPIAADTGHVRLRGRGHACANDDADDDDIARKYDDWRDDRVEKKVHCRDYVANDVMKTVGSAEPLARDDHDQLWRPNDVRVDGEDGDGSQPGGQMGTTDDPGVGRTDGTVDNEETLNGDDDDEQGGQVSGWVESVLDEATDGIGYVQQFEPGRDAQPCLEAAQVEDSHVGDGQRVEICGRTARPHGLPSKDDHGKGIPDGSKQQDEREYVLDQLSSKMKMVEFDPVMIKWRLQWCRVVDVTWWRIAVINEVHHGVRLHHLHGVIQRRFIDAEESERWVIHLIKASFDDNLLRIGQYNQLLTIDAVHVDDLWASKLYVISVNVCNLQCKKLPWFIK